MCTCCALPTWWSWRGGCTRSHSEHGRETPQRRWYFVSRRGRVGRCQVCKSQHHVDIFSIYETRDTLTGRSRGPFCLLPCINKQQGLSPGWSSPSRTAGAPLRGSAKQKPGMPGSSSLIAGWSSPRRPTEAKGLEDRQNKDRACPEAQVLSRGGAAR